MSLSREFELNTKTQNSALKMFNKAYKRPRSENMTDRDCISKRKFLTFIYLKYLNKFIGMD